MNFNKVQFTSAQKAQARDIARLIMLAMNYDCCQYFAGENHTLSDFEDMMTALVEAENSQYSYLNTIVATDERNEVAGICVVYDGKDLHRLREAFINAAKEYLGRDFNDMDDETGEGELYVDSLCVRESFRHNGIATQLLKQSIERAEQMHLPAVGLLVDKGNPDAEKLYRKVGFQYVGDATWGGHPMRHLQYLIKENEQT